jgi:hypothetical protein
MNPCLRFKPKINQLSIRTSDTEKSNLELTCEQLTIKISLSLLGFYEQYSTAPDVPKPLVAEDPVAPARSRQWRHNAEFPARLHHCHRETSTSMLGAPAGPLKSSPLSDYRQGAV